MKSLLHYDSHQRNEGGLSKKLAILLNAFPPIFSGGGGGGHLMREEGGGHLMREEGGGGSFNGPIFSNNS